MFNGLKVEVIKSYIRGRIGGVADVRWIIEELRDLRNNSETARKPRAWTGTE